MSKYKTPGVYVVEKPVFPPSVAQVETAIPAFIGYTEKAQENAPNDLILRPKKISSRLEFEEFYGGPPDLDIEVQLKASNQVDHASVQPVYYMYDSVQMFYLNGGGDCYIVCAGLYPNAVSYENVGNQANPGLYRGLQALEHADEPTIIVFPDALLLGANEFYTLQQRALAQCDALKDRVAVFDLREEDEADENFGWKEGVNAFRNNIGTSYLKYGAAYTPHLRTNLNKTIKYRHFRNTADNPQRFTRSGTRISLQDLTADTNVHTLIQRLDRSIDDLRLIENEVNGLAGVTNLNIRQAFDTLYETARTNNGGAVAYRAALEFLYHVIVAADGWFFDTAVAPHTSDPSMDAPPDYESYQTEAHSKIFRQFDEAVLSIIAFDKASAAAATATGAGRRFDAHSGNLVAANNYGSSETPAIPNPWSTAAGALPTPPANAAAIFAGATNAARRLSSLPRLRALFGQLIAPVADLIKLAQTRMDAQEDALKGQFPDFKNLIQDLNKVLSKLPPSGAIAGVYAHVDRNRGVWKAPANVSLNGVPDLTEHFTRSQTDGLNVDVNFGKSINAIKNITGMGRMVWGARTLAGNDNEWRYISVRRFFNMVEESCKKSTMWAVFEPNDSGTWLKVKGMIANFLTLQWRAGALQGAKPNEAFYVKVGLGETMTQLDILEGRMKVEIGMAVVRPAEFIILTFMHKMVESG